MLTISLYFTNAISLITRCQLLALHRQKQFCLWKVRNALVTPCSGVLPWHDTSQAKAQQKLRKRGFCMSSYSVLGQAIALITRLVGLTWGPSGADRTQVGPILAPRTLLFGWACTVSTQIGDPLGKGQTSCAPDCMGISSKPILITQQCVFVYEVCIS